MRRRARTDHSRPATACSRATWRSSCWWTWTSRSSAPTPTDTREFELQVRAEYWWVPTALYRRQRLAILRTFIMRQSVYATHEFRERYERQARNNISWAMEQLDFGVATFRWTARF